MKATLKIASITLVVAVVVATAAAAQTGVLFVKDNRVGIGISSPTVPLDVVDTAGSGNTVLARFANNGAPHVRYENTVLGVTWLLAPLSNGDWAISKVGTGGPEFVVRQSGKVEMGAGPSFVFTLETNGDLTIGGTLTENSSRELKEGLSRLDGRQILAQVADLPISEWSYKGQEFRHVGPMAEDFHAAFGLGGTDKGLAPRDLAGVTLAALQGLNEVVEEKDREIDRLSREVAELRALVESIATP